MNRKPPRKVAPSDAHALAGELRAFAGKLKRRLREQAADAGDLTPSQVSVLLRLEKDGPATASHLARIEGMRPQSMGPIIAALESAGLVRGSPDPSDGRQTILSLTAACRVRIDEGRAARQDWLSRTIAARLSPAEQQQLGSAMGLLKRLVDD
ncbi:MarR family winged helix-turn-helix transcriptional regulator [Bradyrhizobium oligotrophicum]|uniref:MarR family winged helix-turn-helix transcriptional regulator n=1 Tax=Bradyrhizobium oligotrophicum TaxID=44255 RepID=UPI003EBFD607